MKNILALIFVTLFLFSCSPSVDTTYMEADERLAYSIKLYENEDSEEAIKEFESLILQYPGSRIVDDAIYYLGMTRFQREEYILAAYQFSKLIKGMPTSEFLADAQYMLADCYYELSPDYSLDQQYTKKAIEEFQVFIDIFPLNEKVADAEKKIIELNDKMAKKTYNAAIIYEKLEYYNAAIMYFDNVLEVYHDTQYAPLALYDKINLLISRNRETEALTESQKFLQKYPDDENYNNVLEIKNNLENKLSVNQ